MDVGLLGYGCYIPRFRLKTETVADVWGKNAEEIEKSLGIKEKSIASHDEDAVTLAYEAASQAFLKTDVSPDTMEVCFVGSESHPYAVNPTSTIVAEFLGIGNNYLAADLQFACKAATAGMIATAGLIEAKKIKAGLVIGTDSAQSKPHDILEYTAASASCAYILSSFTQKSVAQLLDFTSFSSDTPDFWRRDGVRFPSHGGRFTGEPAYFTHVEGAAKRLLEKVHMKPSEFDYCVFHMPNGKFPRSVAKRLGFTIEQQKPSLIVDYIGNPYSASSLLGLANVLDQAHENQYIFMVSYGSGAGSDAFILKTTKALIDSQKKGNSFMDYQKDKKYVSYAQYLRLTEKI